MSSIRTRLRIAVGLYWICAAGSLLLLLPGSISGHGDNMERSILAALGAFSGPFTGAIARGFQRCCWEFSLKILPLCGAALGAGILFQLIPLPAWRLEKALRTTAWTLGWLGWFAGIPLSFAHALS